MPRMLATFGKCYPGPPALHPRLHRRGRAAAVGAGLVAAPAGRNLPLLDALLHPGALPDDPDPGGVPGHLFRQGFRTGGAQHRDCRRGHRGGRAAGGGAGRVRLRPAGIPRQAHRSSCLTVVTFLVPFEAIAIPLYELIQGLGWVDTYAALIVPGDRQRHRHLPLPPGVRRNPERSGRRGAARRRLLVAHPLLHLPAADQTGLVGASLLLFLFQWESFLWPLIAVRDERYKVVQVALGDFQLQYQTLWEQLFAASIVAAVIPLLLLLPFQRFYVRSVIGTGLK